MSIQSEKHTEIIQENENNINLLVERFLRSKWNILLIGIIVRQIIALCGVITFVANGMGYYVGEFLFDLIPQPNNITINTTEHERRINECLGSWSTGVELLTFVVVVSIFLIKHIVLHFLISAEFKQSEDSV
jgi:hypothetical protein